MAVISTTVIDPFGTQTDHSTASSKSIFKEQNLRSGNINSDSLNKLTSVFKNNSIIDGLKTDNIYFSNNQRTLNISLTHGKLIQDYVLFDILTSVNMSIDIFSECNIVSVSTTENYFIISGDYLDNFPKYKTFGIFNSDTSQYNHTYWTVLLSEYDSDNDQTKIYTNQTLTIDDASGVIVNDNFPNTDDSIIGTVIVTSQFKYANTIDDNPITFIPVYMNSTYGYTPKFSVDLNKIIYSVLSISKDMVNFNILPTVYKIEDEVVDLVIHGVSYDVHNLTNLVCSTLDGGSISS